MKPAEPEGLHDLTGRQTYQNVDQRGPTTSCKHKGRRGGEAVWMRGEVLFVRENLS